MKCKATTVIKNHGGVYARPAALIVKTASKFMADVSISVPGGVTTDGDWTPCAAMPARRAALDSIMDLLAMDLSRGTPVEIECAGEDAEQALAAMLEIFELGFYMDW